MKKPIIFAFLIYILDQLSKLAVSHFLPYGSSISVIKPLAFFNIVKVQNTGIAFSLLQNKNFIFMVLVFCFLLVLIIWLYKNRSKIPSLQKYAFCFVIAGGFGNLTDRLFRGAVVDFLDFGINYLRWPSFNIADSAVCIGTFLILLDIIISARSQKSAGGK
ncbi:MAG: signal peptidase II [Endomicrobium sp.]|jgi:signal peptidase II|nr:signal peptidase II [Endomicrobium sp.]